MPNFNLKDLMISLPDAEDQIPQTLCHGTQPCLPTLCHGTKPCLPTFCHIPTNCGGHTLCHIPTNCGGLTICHIPTICAHSICHIPTVIDCRFTNCRFSPMDCTPSPYHCGGTITITTPQTATTPIEIEKTDIKTLGLLKEKLASAIKEVEAQISASSKVKKG